MTRDEQILLHLPCYWWFHFDCLHIFSKFPRYYVFIVAQKWPLTLAIFSCVSSPLLTGYFHSRTLFHTYLAILFLFSNKINMFPLLPYSITVVVVRVSIAIKGHHEHRNYFRGKHLIWMLYIFRGLGHYYHGRKYSDAPTGIVQEKELRILHLVNRGCVLVSQPLRSR